MSHPSTSPETVLYEEFTCKVDTVKRSLLNKCKVDARTYIDSCKKTCKSRAMLIDKLEHYLWCRAEDSIDETFQVAVSIAGNWIKVKLGLKRQMECPCLPDDFRGPRGGKLRVCKRCDGEDFYEQSFWLEFDLPCPEELAPSTLYPPRPAEVGLLTMDFDFGFETVGDRLPPKPYLLIIEAMREDIKGMWECLETYGCKGRQMAAEVGVHRVAAMTRQMNNCKDPSAQIVATFDFGGKLHTLVYFPASPGFRGQHRDELKWWHGSKQAGRRGGAWNVEELPRHFHHGQWREHLFNFLFETFDLHKPVHQTQFSGLWNYYSAYFPDAKQPQTGLDLVLSRSRDA